jgi:hypothetical protein
MVANDMAVGRQPGLEQVVEGAVFGAVIRDDHEPSIPRVPRRGPGAKALAQIFAAIEGRHRQDDEAVRFFPRAAHGRSRTVSCDGGGLQARGRCAVQAGRASRWLG